MTLERIQREIQQTLFPEAVVGSGQTNDQVLVFVRSHRADVAERLHATYGDLVKITVGLLDFPLDPGQVDVIDAPVARTPPGVDVRLVLETRLVAPGEDFIGHVEFENKTSTVLTVRTRGQPFVGGISDPAGRLVGRYAGAQVGTGWDPTLQPGEVTRVRVHVGTAGVSADIGYVPEPGTYYAFGWDSDRSPGVVTPAIEVALARS